MFDQIDLNFRNELPSETAKVKPTVSFCQLNMSQCDVTENNSRFVVNVYNGLARHLDKYIRLPVLDGSIRYKVYDPKSNSNISSLQHRSLKISIALFRD